MKITIEETGAYSYALNIDAGAKELEAAIEDDLRGYLMRAHVAAVSPYHLPMDSAMWLYGEQHAELAVDDLVMRIFNEHVASSPKFRVWEASEEFVQSYTYGGDLKARIAFGVRPVVAVKPFEGERLEVAAAGKTHAMVDDAMEALLWNHGTRTPLPEGAVLRASDEATFVVHPLDSDDGERTTDWEFEAQRLVLGQARDAFDEALEQALIGAAVGGRVRFSLRDRYREDAPSPTALMHFEATVQAAERIAPAELTDDLSRRVAPAEGGTVQDLWRWVSQMVDVRRFSDQMANVEACIKERLLELHDLVAPEQVVRQYALELLEEDAGPLIDDNALEELPRPFANSLLWKAERGVKWMILREALLRRFRGELARAYGREDTTADGLAFETGDHAGQDLDGLEDALIEGSTRKKRRAEDRALFSLLAGKFDLVFVAEGGE